MPLSTITITDNIIVTSQISAKLLIQSKAQVNNVCCVGEKTSRLLIENNYNVVKSAKNASVLADFIIKYRKNDTFLFLCGNLRRDELPKKLNENSINLIEKIVYKTHLKTQRFTENFDGVLFFSPSGVESYVQENSLDKTVAFCIGETTAQEARKHTSNTIVATQATIEETILKAISYFKS